MKLNMYCSLRILFFTVMVSVSFAALEEPSYKVSSEDYNDAMGIYNASEPNLVFPNPHPDAQWFPKAGLGLFMHWGIHSVKALQPSWSMIKDYRFAHLPKDEDPNNYIGMNYYHLVEKFNPESYDPDAWLKAAADAGFKYAVLTSKHHDGYALWPSKYGNMSTRTSMGGRDLIKDYVAACRKNGLKIGLYFSPRDWHFPGFPIDDIGFDNNRRGEKYELSDEAAKKLFLDFYAYTICQLRELLTCYGKIDILWFDGLGSWPGIKQQIGDTKVLQTYEWIRSLQPGIVINDRWDKRIGDFATPEGHVPNDEIKGWWESCISIKGHWGYSPEIPMWSIEKFCYTYNEIRRKGGNFLANIGPSPDGTMPSEFYELCEKLKENACESELMSSVVNFYIATDGNDSNPGTIEKPFNTLEGARDAIRQLKLEDKYDDESIVVNMRGGTYEIKQTYELDQRDSGTAVGLIIYRAMKDEEVFISGGVKFLLSEFSEITDPRVLGRLHPDAKGRAVMLDLRKRGITEYGQLPLYGHSMSALVSETRYKTGINAPEFFFNGDPLTLSRWPNECFTEVDKVVDQGDVIRDWQDDRKGQKEYVPLEQRADPPRGFVIAMDRQQLVRWKDAKDVWLYGYWHNNWSDQSVRVAEIDPQRGIVKSLQPSGYGVKSKQRFYVYNLLEEMDLTGEWYLDRENGTLYLIPPENDPKSDLYLSLSTEPLIKMKGVSNVRVEGIDFGYTRGIGIVIDSSCNIEIVNCRVGNTGGQGIRITDGSKNSIRDCEIFNNGSGGISVSGGDILSLTPASNVVENNLIYNYARIEKTYKPAVELSGVGNRAAHNEIHSGAHMAIGFSGNNHIIEYNHIYDVARETDDMAAIYSGRSWTGRGTVIRYNLLRNITGYKAGTHRVSGVYLDDGISGITVEGNIFINLAQGLMFNGGRDNTAVNNVFIDVENMMRSTSLKEAYTTWAASSWKTLNEKFKQMPLNKEPWLSAYPHLTNMLDDEPELPKYTVIKDNVCYNSPLIIGKKGVHEVVAEFGTVKNNIKIEKKPGSYDPESKRFYFDTTSGVFDVMSALKNIQTEKFGRISP